MARTFRVCRESALSVLAIGGLVCIGLVVVGFVWDAQLMMFTTGSMGPSIPAGSVAIVHEVSAGSVAPGDIVTVDRPNALPITHRVVSTRPAGHGSTELVLKGDANPTPDAQPYVVRHVQLLTAAAAGGAPMLEDSHPPIVLVFITLLASFLVTWAFWPRRFDDTQQSDNTERDAS